MTKWKFAYHPTKPNSVVYRELDNGNVESCLVTREDVQEWIDKGNNPLPAMEPKKSYKIFAWKE